jgi:hypothetical protein
VAASQRSPAPRSRRSRRPRPWRTRSARSSGWPACLNPRRRTSSLRRTSGGCRTMCARYCFVITRRGPLQRRGAQAHRVRGLWRDLARCGRRACWRALRRARGPGGRAARGAARGHGLSAREPRLGLQRRGRVGVRRCLRASARDGWLRRLRVGCGACPGHGRLRADGERVARGRRVRSGSIWRVRNGEPGACRRVWRRRQHFNRLQLRSGLVARAARLQGGSAAEGRQEEPRWVAFSTGLRRSRCTDSEVVAAVQVLSDARLCRAACRTSG